LSYFVRLGIYEPHKLVLWLYFLLAVAVIGSIIFLLGKNSEDPRVVAAYKRLSDIYNKVCPELVVQEPEIE